MYANYLILPWKYLRQYLLFRIYVFHLLLLTLYSSSSNIMVTHSKSQFALSSKRDTVPENYKKMHVYQQIFQSYSQKRNDTLRNSFIVFGHLSFFQINQFLVTTNFGSFIYMPFQNQKNKIIVYQNTSMTSIFPFYPLLFRIIHKLCHFCRLQYNDIFNE